MKKLIIGTLSTLTIAVIALLLSPMTPLPGGSLKGDVVSGPVFDWSFASGERFCKLETRHGEPRSITVSCLVSDGKLYVGCSGCSERHWSQALIQEPNVRYQVLDKIYNLVATRVTDQTEVNSVWLTRATKYGDDSPEPAPQDFWFFRLSSAHVIN